MTQNTTDLWTQIKSPTKAAAEQRIISITKCRVHLLAKWQNYGQ